MAREHLSNDDFFTQLASLIETTHQKGHGSVYLTQKRLTFGSSAPSSPTGKVPDDPLWDLHPPNPLPLIVRATDGKSHKLDKEGGATAKGGIGRTKNAEKVKLSTVVQPDDIEAFFTRYAEVCKGGMRGLRRRDRSKRKKKDKGKKKGLAESVKT
ncbi:hypothetical protein LTR35_009635 [Friedmanniomyces endolithicus]|uniref:Signal recognition particle subunit SRP14 n=1 Tax=Friedmanniomyces endolithicus TaxID=329885 RepID=A0AAN6J9D2_9PEZI|nr:hypothetical protein LTR35_009635 [Friedmanniomyces endolithicus]KAK0301158.1 hypothetical protein LTS00_000307 [Friedmanniomyces endolithicus]KAK0321251.1 hypothetical protein LTR82_007703 [Friedmanniomyces endolithicus]KAK0983875.1 hypothetical protein LTR54_014167 [Friedmanniomyces endolithicus]